MARCPHISLLAPVFCGLTWRIASFPKALTEVNLKKTACSNGSSARDTDCVVLLFLAIVLEKSGYVYSVWGAGEIV